MHRGDWLPAMLDLMNWLKLLIAPVLPTGSFFFSQFVTFPVMLFAKILIICTKRHPSNGIAGHYAVLSLAVLVTQMQSNYSI